MKSAENCHHSSMKRNRMHLGRQNFQRRAIKSWILSAIRSYHLFFLVSTHVKSIKFLIDLHIIMNLDYFEIR